MKCKICLKNFSGWQYAFHDGKRDIIVICDDCVKKELKKN